MGYLGAKPQREKSKCFGFSTFRLWLQTSTAASTPRTADTGRRANLWTRGLRITGLRGKQATAGELLHIHFDTNVPADTVPHHHRGGAMLEASASIQLGMYVGGRG